MAVNAHIRREISLVGHKIEFEAKKTVSFHSLIRIFHPKSIRIRYQGRCQINRPKHNHKHNQKKERMIQHSICPLRHPARKKRNGQHDTANNRKQRRHQLLENFQQTWNSPIPPAVELLNLVVKFMHLAVININKIHAKQFIHIKLIHHKKQCGIHIILPFCEQCFPKCQKCFHAKSDKHQFPQPPYIPCSGKLPNDPCRKVDADIWGEHIPHHGYKAGKNKLRIPFVDYPKTPAI